MNVSRLQSRQREHDERFHPDIYAGPQAERLAHYAFHGMKYTGRIASIIREKPDQHVSKLQQTVADAFIITLATANALNLDLHPLDMPDLPQSMALPEDVARSLLISYAIYQGRIAKALDARDHVESFPIGQELRDSTKEVAHELTQAAHHLRMNLEQAVFERWHSIERHRVP